MNTRWEEEKSRGRFFFFGQMSQFEFCENILSLTKKKNSNKIVAFVDIRYLCAGKQVDIAHAELRM